MQNENKKSLTISHPKEHFKYLIAEKQFDMNKQKY